jgi:uncharacterized protein YjbI with pentapeptide repeats
MADTEQLALLKNDVAAWNAWRENNPKMEIDLTEADLTGANLYVANLIDANLHGAKLLSFA